MAQFPGGMSEALVKELAVRLNVSVVAAHYDKAVGVILAQRQ